MRSTLALAFVFIVLVAGCSARRPPLQPTPASAASPSSSPPRGATGPATTPVAAGEAKDPLPRVIRRLVREQKEELADMMKLVAVVGDGRGRERALAETTTLAIELERIEGTLEGADSDGLDRSVLRLQRLESKIDVLHDALRFANPAPGSAKEVDEKVAP